MKILLTGASGYIGKNLSEYLLGRGHSVTELTRRLHDIRIPLTTIRDDTFDAIIHVAGNPSAKACIADPSSAIHDNIIGTHNILEYARRNCVKRFIFFSTCEVYTGNPDARETDVPRCTNMYSATKLSAEHLCEAYFHSYGFMNSCVIFRLIHSYGKYCQDDRFPSIVMRKFSSEDVPHFVFRTKSRKRWIDVKDVCKKTECVLHTCKGFEVFNLVGDENLALDEFVNKLGNGREFSFEYDTSTLTPGYPNESNANGEKLKKHLMTFFPA